MFVTGVQSVGSKGVNSVQVAAVDIKEVNKQTSQNNDSPKTGVAPKPGDPQPVVFPRAGVALDQRPVALRHEQAASKYRSYGGSHDDHNSSS
jgi:hypothetical protein